MARLNHRYDIRVTLLIENFDRSRCQCSSFDSGLRPVYYLQADRLVGLVVKTPASGAEGPGFESHSRRDFSGTSHASDSKIGTPVATLPGAWRYRVSAGAGRSGVSML